MKTNIKNLFTCLDVASTRSRVLRVLIAGLGFLPAGRMPAQTFTTLHSFARYPSDGAFPFAGLILSGSTLYGTTEVGGSGSVGTVFRLRVIIPPAEALQNLISLVNSVMLPQGTRQPLLATLDAALAALNGGNTGAAINILEAVEHQVRAQITPLDPSLAEELIEAAQEIINALNPESKARS